MPQYVDIVILHVFQYCKVVLMYSVKYLKIEGGDVLTLFLCFFFSSVLLYSAWWQM